MAGALIDMDSAKIKKTYEPSMMSHKMENGMMMHDNKKELKKNNEYMAMVNAKVAKKGKKGGAVEIPDEMEDSRSMTEFYSELLSYGPSILKDAVRKGDPFERFKLTLKFAFSIIHNIINQDVKRRPIVPIVGETFEGHFILKDITNIYMETDYIDYTYIDLLTLADVRVKVD
jgi:Oxysterol-binding protein